MGIKSRNCVITFLILQTFKRVRMTTVSKVRVHLRFWLINAFNSAALSVSFIARRTQVSNEIHRPADVNSLSNEDKNVPTTLK